MRDVVVRMPILGIVIGFLNLGEVRNKTLPWTSGGWTSACSGIGSESLLGNKEVQEGWT